MVEVVGVLLAAGANVEIRDADGHLAGDTFSSKARLPDYCGVSFKKHARFVAGTLLSTRGQIYFFSGGKLDLVV